MYKLEPIKMLPERKKKKKKKKKCGRNRAFGNTSCQMQQNKLMVVAFEGKFVSKQFAHCCQNYIDRKSLFDQ